MTFLVPMPELDPGPELDPCPVIWSPAGETTYQLAPYATSPSPFVSPGFWSPENR